MIALLVGAVAAVALGAVVLGVLSGVAMRGEWVLLAVILVGVLAFIGAFEWAEERGPAAWRPFTAASAALRRARDAAVEPKIVAVEMFIRHNKTPLTTFAVLLGFVAVVAAPPVEEQELRLVLYVVGLVLLGFCSILVDNARAKEAAERARQDKARRERELEEARRRREADPQYQREQREAAERREREEAEQERRYQDARRAQRERQEMERVEAEAKKEWTRRMRDWGPLVKRSLLWHYGDGADLEAYARHHWRDILRDRQWIVGRYEDPAEPLFDEHRRWEIACWALEAMPAEIAERVPEHDRNENHLSWVLRRLYADRREKLLPLAERFEAEAEAERVQAEAAAARVRKGHVEGADDELAGEKGKLVQRLQLALQRDDLKQVEHEIIGERIERIRRDPALTEQEKAERIGDLESNAVSRDTLKRLRRQGLVG